jgi:PAS domain S-box-containing protein
MADSGKPKAAGYALEQNAPRLRGLLETIPGFIWTADATGEIDYISPRFLAFVGRDEARFKSAFWPEFVHPEDMPKVISEWARVNARLVSYRIDVRLLRNDGVWRWLDIRAEPDLDATGHLLGWYGYGEDQHDQKEMADALLASEGRYREMAARLTDANRLKDEFLATLAHELRNPLAPIRNALQLIKLAPEDRSVTATAREMMERQLTQMVRLIDDLLDLSRVSRGLVELRRSRFSLAVALKDAVETSRPQVEQAGHLLTMSIPDEALEVEADPTRIVQIFANLLNNAAKFTPRGGRIELSLKRGEDMRAVVTVRDSGIGIPAAMLNRIFDMFTQVDRSHTHIGGGLGIGLALVRRLVEMHGGSVEARSKGVGTGSEFVVRLPLAPEKAPVSVADDSAVAQDEQAAMSLRIVVADDNVDAALSLSMMLNVLGHETRIAYDGKQALVIAREFQPDVMVLDIGMPGLSGHDLARAVRLEPWGRGVLLIAASGWGQPEDKQNSRDAGFDHHLVKPVEYEVLDKLLRDRSG